MGTRDYVTKCGFTKVVVGLSGGIDSALTAAIAVEALGAENVRGVFMPSRYTSRDNFEDTVRLAANLGIELIEVPIDGMFNQFLQHLSPAFDADAPGVTEQNIQARIRGTILMAFSNRDGSLLLTTGNKSELAVGYCTLYGDMSGGLAVISDVPKTMVYEISRHLNADREVIPPRIIEKAPSAELKPGQTDQDDLPAYEVLDGILKAYVEDLKTVDEMVAMGFERALVEDVIARIIRNEYKRQQAAPGLRVTSKAFGYGRRYPIAQGFRPGAACAP
jgi:NAD+ synthetase